VHLAGTVESLASRGYGGALVPPRAEGGARREFGELRVRVQHAGGQPGVAFTLPVVLFLFVVAIGTDYNMLMSNRLREEFASGVSPRQVVANAVRHAAPPIVAAGIVLATSFGSLMISDDHATQQTGFGMAIGILFA
jgi:putative drug exporter of the RND superfamily